MESRVRIGATDYTLRERDIDWSDDTNYFGQIDYRKAIIDYSNVQGKRQTGKTIIHEILHGLFKEYGLNPDIAEEVEERVVTTLSHGLVCVIRDNPNLAEQIFNCIKD